jgi:hypothetical protein
MYSIKTFFTASDNSLGTALNKAESDLLQWLDSEKDIELISVIPQHHIDEQAQEKYIYWITVAYAK